MRRITLALVLLLSGIVQATAQNPVPFLNQPVVPSAVAPRGPVAPSGPGARRVVPLLLLFLALAAVAAMDSRLRGNDGTRKQVPNFFSLVPGRGSPSADGPGGRVASLLSRVPILPRLPISYFLLPLCLLVMLLWPGCGGGGDNAIRNPGTPAGSYLLTITATTASGSGTVTQTITLNLKVT